MKIKPGEWLKKPWASRMKEILSVVITQEMERIRGYRK
jgi:hypothetical protein